MRPDPHPSSRDESDRIIYLGDVRRKRSRRRVPDRQYLIALAILALAGWVGWLLVVLTLEPARLLTYLAFFTPLAVAVAASAAIALYALEWRSGRFPSLRASVRRGILIAVLVVVNLALQASHHWSVPAGGVSVLGAIAVEAASERRAA